MAKVSNMLEKIKNSSIEINREKSLKKKNAPAEGEFFPFTISISVYNVEIFFARRCILAFLTLGPS